MERPKGYSITARRNNDRWRDDPEWSGFDKWAVTLRNPQGKTLSTQFYMGPGHEGAKPSFELVMDALISDALGYENSRDFNDYCAEYGMETETAAERRRAQKIYKECERLAPRVRAFLGEDFDHLAYGGDDT
jgi:hypothetical protein